MRWNLIFAFIVLGAMACVAQSRRSKTGDTAIRPIAAVHAVGSHRFPETDIVTASGLAPGQQVSPDDIRTATERMGTTGAFGEVAYQYGATLKGWDIELRVRDADKFAPARFDNFVWLPPQELQAKLHDAVPLFTGELPVTGNLPDRVADAAQALLAQMQIGGSVEYTRSTEKEDGPVTGFVYRVDNVSTPIHAVQITGAGPAILPALDDAAQRLVGVEYSETRIDTFIRSDLLPVYLRRGYLRASFSPPVPAVNRSSGEETTVDVRLSVTEGLQYRLGAVELPANSPLSQAVLAKQVHLTPGDPVDEVELRANLNAVRQMYRARGYVQVAIDVQRDLNDAAAVVRYVVSIKPGDVYHMADLDVIGFPAADAAQLREAWQLQKGEVFDGTYVERYLQSVRGGVSSRVHIQEDIHPNEKTVDVVVRPPS